MVMVTFNCQLDVTFNNLENRISMTYCLNLLDLWAYMWGIVETVN